MLSACVAILRTIQSNENKVRFTIEGPNAANNEAIKKHIEIEMGQLEPYINDSQTIVFQFYTSGDHLHNVTIRLNQKDKEVTAQSSHFNPYTAISTVCASLKRRLAQKVL